jgi:hypothetical protein
MAGDYDINELLQYSGPSLREQEPMGDGVMLLDYRSTDENERKIAILLSSQGIPFHIERPRQGWKGQIHLIVTVPRGLVQQAEAVLGAAARVSAIDVVEGLDGPRSR